MGGGYSGPGRALAQVLGAQVMVLHLAQAFCKLGAELTRLTGLTDQVTFQHGSALDLPCAEASFDAAWMQNAIMSIPDKDRLLQELFRAQCPGARLVIQDQTSGPDQPPTYPLPWAADPAISFLVTPERMRQALAQAGFRQAAEQIHPRPLPAPGQPTPVDQGLRLINPRLAEVMSENDNLNYAEERLLHAWYLAERP